MELNTLSKLSEVENSDNSKAGNFIYVGIYDFVNSGDETADAKKDALKSAGVNVADTITRIGDAMREAMKI